MISLRPSGHRHTTTTKGSMMRRTTTLTGLTMAAALALSACGGQQDRLSLIHISEPTRPY